MGVQGWSWLLKQKGYLPDTAQSQINSLLCCTCSLWRDGSATEDDALASRLTVIPKSSHLLIDGNGLAFWIHQVAYARHMAMVFSSRNNNSNNNGNSIRYKQLIQQHRSPCSLKKKLSTLTPIQARQLLPNLLPVKLLSDVTKEFVVQLRDRHNMKLTVYWDGDKRRVFKQATDDKRQERPVQEWSNLQLYCETGMLPAGLTKACELETLLPKTCLWKAEISEAFYQCKIAQVTCDEEADAAMALQASKDPHSYIVGQDSDFCFFPAVNYIPLNTLDADPSSSLVTAVVIRRESLARELHLPDEASMVEVAILLGNDYLIDPSQAQLNAPADALVVRKGLSWQQVLEFIRQQGPGYRVTSRSEDVQETLLFIRTLYELESLDNYELQDHDRSRDQSNLISDSGIYDDDAGDVIFGPSSNTTNDHSLRPSIPDDMPAELLKLDLRLDKSPKDAVLRCLQAYVDMIQSTGNGESDDAVRMITALHLDVLRDLTTPATTRATSSAIHKNKDDAENDDDKDNINVNWRPAWIDVPAVYLVERLISTVLLEQNTPLAHVSLPSALFDSCAFLEQMHKIRQRQLVQESRNNAVIVDEQARQTPTVTATTRPAHLDVGKAETLPIDEHEEKILKNIAQNRVTIIQGETGCGKSSRIPVMVLKAPPPPDCNLQETRIFICQPRRIAAKGLVERVRSVEPELGQHFALRLGHGIREYESEHTRAWFCTTGYLVRLLANHPEKFDNISHLIIDEIHDRGVDLDLLCLLCRRLLRTNSHIRLVLMSATLAAALYQGYFDVSQPPIEVGARRFPVEEVYLEDLQYNRLPLSQKAKTLASGLAIECNKLRCRFTPSMSYMEKLENLATHIVASTGKGGTSILVFVPGMNEIVAIIELIEQLFVPGITFSTIPVHSDIPFEDQLAVFSETKSDECRVIVATNSAESSLTLPALDHVIDLGLCRQIVYNEASHRQMLTSAWISRASATQRAGRTGRIRSGTVYRLYTRTCYQNHMEAFEPGEMMRIPLDSVILMLKGILPHHESASEVLLECLEPPNESTIVRSFFSLYKSRYISSPDDEGEITNLGSFVSSLGIDLSLGSLIGLGIQFGVGPEAIHMAAALSFPAKPWIMSNRLNHGETEFNKMSSKTFVSRCHFDSNLFSEPLALMNLIWDYDRTGSNKQQWCYNYGLFGPRVKRLSSTCLNLQRRVADVLELRPEYLDLNAPPRELCQGKLTVLRAIQVWVFHDTMIEWRPKQKISRPSPVEFIIPLRKDTDPLKEDHIHQILIKDRHPFELRSSRMVQQQAVFNPLQPFDSSLAGVSDGIENRLLSYAIENEFVVVFLRTKDSAMAYVSTAVRTSDVASVIEALTGKLESCGLVKGIEATGKARGRAERTCGKWVVVQAPDNGDRVFRKFSSTSLSAKKIKFFDQDFTSLLQSTQSLKSVCLQLKIQKSYALAATFYGKNVEGMSPVDLRDLFESLDKVKPSTQVSAVRQELAFPVVRAGPWNPIEKLSGGKVDQWPRAIVECIPEGARVVVALAWTQRRERIIWLQPLEEERLKAEKKDDEEEQDDNLLCMHPDCKAWGAWVRASTGSTVYLPDLTVPTSAIPLDGAHLLQCCCANALDIKGGALKVEGVTLLPSGRAFGLLCQISFGLMEISDDEYDTMGKSIAMGPDGRPLPAAEYSDLLQRCKKAHEVNEMSRNLGEELVCEPSCVVALLELFDGLWGEEILPWADLFKNPFIVSNLKKARHKRAETPKARDKRSNNEAEAQKSTGSDFPLTMLFGESTDTQQPSIPAATKRPTGSDKRTTQSKKLNGKKGNKKKHQGQMISQLAGGDPEQIAFPENIRILFATDLSGGKQVGTDELPSPNILALVIQKFARKNSQMRFAGHSANWTLFRLTDGQKECFQARFQPINLAPNVTSNKDTNIDLPRWLKKKKNSSVRPTSLTDVLECVPSSFSAILSSGSVESSKAGVFYQTIDMAIRVECALWLEAQFRVGQKHWYQTSMTEMIEILSNEMKDRKQKKKAATKATQQKAKPHRRVVS